MGVKLKTLTFNSGRQEAMVAFYRALGANLESKQVTIGGLLFTGKMGEITLSIYGAVKTTSELSRHVGLQVQVRKIEPIVDLIRKVPEAQVLSDIQDFQDGKSIFLTDPDGHSVELIEPGS